MDSTMLSRFLTPHRASQDAWEFSRQTFFFFSSHQNVRFVECWTFHRKDIAFVELLMQHSQGHVTVMGWCEELLTNQFLHTPREPGLLICSQDPRLMTGGAQDFSKSLSCSSWSNNGIILAVHGPRAPTNSSQLTLSLSCWTVPHQSGNPMTKTDLNLFALVEVIALSFTFKNPCPAPIPSAPITRQHTETPQPLRPGQSIALVQLLFANNVLRATCPYVQSHFLPAATFSRA